MSDKIMRVGMEEVTRKKHELLVQNLCKDGDEILQSLCPEKAHLLHMIIGLSGEVGELLDSIKKHVFYEQQPNTANFIEELGDIEFYLQGLRSALNLNRNDILEGNLDKLSTRYNEGSFSNKAAKERADKS